VAAAGTQQFSVQNLPSGANVTWSISPATGGISTDGLYTAPSDVTSQTTITVTATNSSTNAVFGTASLTLRASPTPKVSPAKVTLAPAGTQQFSVEHLPSGDSVNWSISPATGGISTDGLYTAPSDVTSQTTITVTATNSSTNAVLGTATLTLQTKAVANIVLPVEVFGTNATTVPVSFTIPSAASVTGQLELWLQIHGLEYQAEASVQVNNSVWFPLSNATVTLPAQDVTFGGIGGGFSTHSMTVALPVGVVTTGANTVSFRFNGTDGFSSGFRVLAFNLQVNGTNLIPASAFVETNPATWTPPLNDATDIAVGLNLWQTASLVDPASGATVPIMAHCADCHAIDGRDLKYFNYSNASIEARAKFHGLTAQQGAQIASYIRTLDVPAPIYATPWNPPYQPGQDIDSRAVTDWAAGAGLGAVLDQDSDMLAYLMPGGSTANWAASAYLNQREIPIPIQLLDWNHWLPRIHPLDAWGSSFLSSSWYQLYLDTREALVPGNATVDAQVLGPNGKFIYWDTNEAAFLQPLAANEAMANTRFQLNYYSSELWGVTKLWEIEQQFELEGMEQTFFGPTAPSRGWLGNAVFSTSPIHSSLPIPSAALGNGQAVTEAYFSYNWYHLQLILNEDSGSPLSDTIDWPYAMAFVTNNLTWNAYVPPTGPRVGVAGLLLEWLIKALQDDQLNDAQSPVAMVNFPGQVSWMLDISPAQKTQLIDAYLTVWFAQFGAYTPAQFEALPMVAPFNTDPTQVRFGSDLIYALPQLLYQGADAALLNQIAAWASTIWPSYNWTAGLNKTCAAGNLGQVFCQ
jgi:hypothetical protein